MKNFILKHKLIILIILIGLFLRAYKYHQFFYYNHDHDLEGWIIKDILYNHHFRLIGQETSQHGVFIGALWYYLLIPFYLLWNMDPIGGVWLSVIVGVCAIASIYFVFTKIWNKKVGLIGAGIYAFSNLIVFTDREVVPTTPVMLWTIWFLYAVYLIKQGKQKQGFILAVILIALIWHINLALVLVTPLISLAFLFSKKRLQIKPFLISLVTLLFLMLPFFVFEAKHNFIQTHAVFAANQSSAASFLAKLDRTMQLVYKNTTALFFGQEALANSMVSFWALAFGFALLTYKKIIKKDWAIVFFLWQIVFILFFSFNQINLSEYYLNGMNVVWIGLASLLLVQIYTSKSFKWLAIAIGFIFILANSYRFTHVVVNQSGYLERTAIINYIKQDSLKHNYPCVSISFITSPGNDLGYRYLIWKTKLKTKPISTAVPVYTIIFPQSLVDSFDKSFGALGLVKPDYSRYNEDQVNSACIGEDYNLTNSMFGFTN